MNDTLNHTPTLAGVYRQLDELLAFIGRVREGAPIIWTDTQTGEKHTANTDDNLAFIEDRLLFMASDVEDLTKRVLHITGRLNNETN